MANQIVCVLATTYGSEQAEDMALKFCRWGKGWILTIYV